MEKISYEKFVKLVNSFDEFNEKLLFALYEKYGKEIINTYFDKMSSDLQENDFLIFAKKYSAYFDNIYDEVFDMKIVAKTLNMKEEDVLTAYGSLVTKNLIKVNAEKDCFGKIREKVCLDNFYNEIKNDYKMKEKEVTKEDIYSVFEKEFGRTLSIYLKLVAPL